MLTLRTKYNELSAKKAATSLMMLRQNYYNQGEKAGKLLAWRIKQKQSERTINSIEDNKRNITSDPAKINNTFLRLYTPLNIQTMVHKQPFSR